MSLETGFSVRLPPALRLRLAAVSTRSALKQSDLVRMAVEDYVSRAEASGQIQIPVLQETPAPSAPLPPRQEVIYTAPAPKKVTRRRSPLPSSR